MTGHDKGNAYPFHAFKIGIPKGKENTMKYPYHVFYNNKSYAPFEEVPDGNEEIKEESVADAVEDAVEEIKEEAEEVAEEPKYTRTVINRMNVETLKKVAKENGISKIDGKSGADLKKLLIEKLGL